MNRKLMRALIGLKVYLDAHEVEIKASGDYITIAVEDDITHVGALKGPVNHDTVNDFLEYSNDIESFTVKSNLN